MQEDSGLLNRRTFFKFSGAALAGVSRSHAWTQSAESRRAELLTSRKAPGSPIILRSTDLELVLDRNDGMPYEYRLIGLDRRMRGEDFGNPLIATLFDKAQGTMKTVPQRVAKETAGKSRADFAFQLSSEFRPQVAFTLRYEVSGATVNVTLRDIRESPGYELIEVAIPRLVTVREEEGNAWLAHGDDGGWFVYLKDAKAGSLKPNTFWGDVLATLPVVMIGNDGVLCVQETTAFIDGTALNVVGEPGSRRASLGTTKKYRVNGSLCYDMNTGPGTPRNCGNPQTPNLLIEQEPSCRLDFIAASDTNSPVSWLDGAKLVRKRMPEIPKHLYDNAFVYGLRCDEPSYPKPSATFEQCEELIRQIAELTDYSPQIVHLWGWQYRGKDTGYPAVQEVNQRIGGYDGMMQLMQKAREFNCIVTLSDNYDDAYRSSPAWDPKIIARRPDGELWESRNWTGENSYIVGLAKYMAGPGIERVRYTCERYKLPETTHIDVLSYFSIRNDWDPANPASGIKNLEAGRYKVLDEFAKRGVDVSSEALRYAFIGKISAFWYMTGPGTCPFGGVPIPLLSAIYRQSSIWGQSGRAGEISDRMMKMLFYNGCSHAIVRADMDLNDALDTFYLVMVPWFQLHARNIESFHREGERTTIVLEGNSEIQIDWSNKTYSASLEKGPILDGASICCPLGGASPSSPFVNRIAFYSLTARQLTAQMPSGWQASEIRAARMTVKGPEEFTVEARNGIITARINAREPVIVYRNESANKRRYSR